MPRPPGRRNAGYEARRAALAARLAPALVDGSGQPSSLRELAAAASVSVPTLRHYFGDLDGAVRAALAEAERGAAHYLTWMADPGELSLADSLAAVEARLRAGWGHGLGTLFGAALTHGLGHAARGPAVVDHVLEPTLQALEARLAVHHARGELPPLDLRAAALTFLSPLLLALLHQQGLGGAACRPLDLDAFADAHLHGWLSGWCRGP